MRACGLSSATWKESEQLFMVEDKADSWSNHAESLTIWQNSWAHNDHLESKQLVFRPRQLLIIIRMTSSSASQGKCRPYWKENRWKVASLNETLGRTCLEKKGWKNSSLCAHHAAAFRKSKKRLNWKFTNYLWSAGRFERRETLEFSEHKFQHFLSCWSRSNPKLNPGCWQGPRG